MRYCHQFQFITSFKSVTHRFPNSTFFFSDLFHRRTRFTSMGFFFHYHFGSTSNWSSLWLTTLQFKHSSTKQIVSFHAHYIFIARMQWLTKNFGNVHTNNQIHLLKMEILFLAIWLSRQLVFLMGLKHCHIQGPFLPTISTFLSQTNC
jgi:hypothetical protein